MQEGHFNAKNSQIWASAFASKYIALFYEDNKQQVRLIHFCCSQFNVSVQTDSYCHRIPYAQKQSLIPVFCY